MSHDDENPWKLTQQILGVKEANRLLHNIRQSVIDGKTFDYVLENVYYLVSPLLDKVIAAQSEPVFEKFTTELREEREKVIELEEQLASSKIINSALEARLDLLTESEERYAKLFSEKLEENRKLQMSTELLQAQLIAEQRKHDHKAQRQHEAQLPNSIEEFFDAFPFQ